jgi:membrane protein insertase Oxa1/YidC/SpoIIIJ
MGKEKLLESGQKDLNNSQKMRSQSKSASYYISKNRYGGAGKDESDSSDDEDSTIRKQNPQIMDHTPITQRKMIGDEIRKGFVKLDWKGTYFTLIKGFVCTGIIYLPKSFINGGWGFSILVFIFSMLLTMTCA